MKFLLIAAAFIAVAVAGPVLPGGAGPAPVILEPIIVGPAIFDEFQPIQVGPAVVADPQPIIVGPAVVDNAVSEVQSPVVQIILNINSQSQVVDIPIPSPVNVVEEAENAVIPDDVIEIIPSPVQVVDVQPAEVGAPILPSPVINLPEELV